MATADTMEPMAAQVLTPETTLDELNAKDRCDQSLCSAQAYMKFEFPANGHSLLFCGHHGAKVEASLVAVGAVLHDERHKLLVKN